MHCEFSELQFAFGLLNELVNNCWAPGRAWSLPIFPTQREEAALGYDVKMKGPIRTLYLQFKVPEKVTSSRGKYWEEFEAPYYQFKIWPDARSHQHNILVDLANKDPHNKVYYCSPGFHTGEEFERFFCHQQIAKKTIYVPCAKLEKISGKDRHNICYTLEPLRKSKMHSQTYQIEGFDLEGLKMDAEQAVPYDDIHTCLEGVARNFNLNVGNENSTIMRLERIAHQLLMRENLNLLLLGE